MKVLLLGGTGNFGALIAQAAATLPGIELVVAGRRAGAAADLAARIGARAVAVDTARADLADLLRAQRCDWVVNAAGPFQGAAADLARAAIAARTHYVDIADARAFVCGITALDAAARAAGVAVVSGASSVPALSGAVVDRYAGEFIALEEIHLGIASSARPPGASTIAGALAGCGRSFAAWRDGGWRDVPAWRGWRRHAFAEGFSSWLADCDVPDLELLPQRYPALRTVTFGAGAGGSAAQALLWAVSFLPAGAFVARAATLHAMASRLAVLGQHRSGMFVLMRGRGPDGAPLGLRWELTADRHEGRRVPCMGVVALLRKALKGVLPPAGAGPCVGLLDLDEYLAEVAPYVRVRVSAGCAAGPRH